MDEKSEAMPAPAPKTENIEGKPLAELADAVAKLDGVTLPQIKPKRGPGRPMKNPGPPGAKKPELKVAGTGATNSDPIDGQMPLKGLPPLARRAGSRVGIGSAGDPYAQLDTWVRDGKVLVEQIRREHPNSNVGDVVDPRSAGIRQLGEPMLPKEILSTSLLGTYELAAEKVDLPKDKIPPVSSFDRLAGTWAEASRYWATSASPAQVALGSAIVQTGMIATPLVVAAWAKLEARK